MAGIKPAGLGAGHPLQSNCVSDKRRPVNRGGDEHEY